MLVVDALLVCVNTNPHKGFVIIIITNNNHHNNNHNKTYSNMQFLDIYDLGMK